MSEQNYYEETLARVKELIKNENIKKAITILDVELNMPYIPEKYEAQFINLREEIIFNQEAKIKNQSLTEEQIVEYLFSRDDIKEAAAIDSLSKINVRGIKDKVINWINKYGEEKPIARAFIYEVFVEQEINVELIFDGVQLNPAINKSILDDHEVKIALATFEDQIDIAPHMLKSLVDEFRHYLLVTFPILPKDGEKFAINFAQAFKSMFDDDIELSTEELEIQKIIKS